MDYFFKTKYYERNVFDDLNHYYFLDQIVFIAVMWFIYLAIK